jgi:hypothetical protein
MVGKAMILSCLFVVAAMTRFERELDVAYAIATKLAAPVVVDTMQSRSEATITEWPFSWEIDAPNFNVTFSKERQWPTEFMLKGRSITHQTSALSEERCEAILEGRLAEYIPDGWQINGLHSSSAAGSLEFGFRWATASEPSVKWMAYFVWSVDIDASTGSIWFLNLRCPLPFDEATRKGVLPEGDLAAAAETAYSGYQPFSTARYSGEMVSGIPDFATTDNAMEQRHYDLVSKRQSMLMYRLVFTTPDSHKQLWYIDACTGRPLAVQSIYFGSLGSPVGPIPPVGALFGVSEAAKYREALRPVPSSSSHGTGLQVTLWGSNHQIIHGKLSKEGILAVGKERYFVGPKLRLQALAAKTPLTKMKKPAKVIRPTRQSLELRRAPSAGVR